MSDDYADGSRLRALALLTLIVLLIIGAVILADCAQAEAIKHDPDQAAEIERLHTALRLRTAELEVARGMLRACERRAAK